VCQNCTAVELGPAVGVQFINGKFCVPNQKCEAPKNLDPL